MKTCYVCKKEYPATKEFFYKNRANKDGFHGECKLCAKVQSIAYQNTTKGKEVHKKSINKYQQTAKGKLTARRASLKAIYGIAGDEYDKLLESQKGHCALCGMSPKDNRKRLAVDHNHVTGKVRGLLCDRCNKGLGNFKDNIEVLKKAIKYL